MCMYNESQIHVLHLQIGPSVLKSKVLTLQQKSLSLDTVLSSLGKLFQNLSDHSVEYGISC